MLVTASRDFERRRKRIFKLVSDPARIEALIRNQAGSVATTAGDPETGVGTVWTFDLPTAGTRHSAALTLTGVRPDDRMTLSMVSDSLDGDIQIDFAVLPENHCKASISITLKPKSLAARVTVQTVRLARGTVEKKLRQVLEALARPQAAANREVGPA